MSWNGSFHPQGAHAYPGFNSDMTYDYQQHRQGRSSHSGHNFFDPSSTLEYPSVEENHSSLGAPGEILEDSHLKMRRSLSTEAE